MYPCKHRYLPYGSSPHVRGTCDVQQLSLFSLSVHPRTCGEHRFDIIYTSVQCGSSPHVRGTCDIRQGSATPIGSSPHVRGTVAVTQYRARSSPVHPRTCGEHAIQPDASVRPPVHPRTCGEHRAIVTESAHGKRFIPARAGNMPIMAASIVAPRPVHPRTCGEHDHRGVTGPTNRFIPARAGNIGYPDRTVQRTAVHPRTCGEHVSCSDLTPRPSGSSPHVRGTCLRVVRSSVDPVHPRTCGEHGTASRIAGARTVHPRTCGEHFIACSNPDDISVHPRTCGEHCTGNSTAMVACGSSPHVRGTLCR